MNSWFPVTRSTLSGQALLEEVLPDYDIGLPIECKFLNLGLKDTYIIKTTTARKYILRIYRFGWRTLSEILYELDVLIHLSRKGIPVSAPLPDKSGGFTRGLPAPEGMRHAVLFTLHPAKNHHLKKKPMPFTMARLWLTFIAQCKIDLVRAPD